MTFLQVNSSSKNYSNAFYTSKQGFTLVELMIAIAVVSILSVIALPSLNNFMVKMRVDNEISEVQRLLLTARNMAINTGKNTTVCPLSGTTCSTNWQNEISVFTNDTIDNSKYEAPADELVKIKEAIKSGDELKFAMARVVYAPSGRLISGQGLFAYCPKGAPDESRGIDVSISGRSYLSSDTDNDGKDEDRNGNEIVCG